MTTAQFVHNDESHDKPVTAQYRRGKPGISTASPSCLNKRICREHTQKTDKSFTTGLLAGWAAPGRGGALQTLQKHIRHVNSISGPKKEWLQLTCWLIVKLQWLSKQRSSWNTLLFYNKLKFITEQSKEGSKKHSATGFPQEGSNLPGFKQMEPGKLSINEKLPKKLNASRAVTATKIKNTLFFITGKALWPTTYLQQKHPKGKA